MSALAPSTPSSTFGFKSWTAIAVLGLVGYSVYFDYRRRSDPEFRKQIRKSNRKAKTILDTYEKNRSSSAPSAAPSGLGEFSMKDFEEPKPENPELLGEWILKQLQMGEALLAQGPQAIEPAMTCFIRALLNFPNPDQLLSMLSRSIPQPVFDVLVQLYTEALKKQSEDSKASELVVE